jgi:hypothetical protein
MRRVLCLVAVAWLLVPAFRVSAGGLEYAGAGATALGRGGATAALAEDPMVLSNNPAGLAELRGNQILLDINYALMKACVDPLGYYGWGAYGGGTPSRLSGYGKTLDLNLGDNNPGPADAYYAGTLDTVCMKQNPLPVPQLGLTFRLTERLGVGLGLMFPAATPQGKWGGENGVIDTPAGLRPAATRYMLLNTGTLGVFPVIGFGYRITKWLRIGATFEWGMINVDNVNMAAAVGGTSPANDIVAHLKATDWFVPAVNASIHIVPIDSLDIVGNFRAQGDLDAAGSIFFTTGVFDPRSVPHVTEEKVQSLHQKFPWKFGGGIRYSNRLAPRPAGTGQDDGRDRVHDQMEDEKWDVELDLEYQNNSRVQEQRLTYAPMQAVAFESTAHTISTTPFPAAPRPGASTDTIIPKRWTDQISARLGGTYNVLPGLLALSLGAHYENRGVDPAYMQIDYWPVSRVGLHAGVKVRVGRTIDIVASYAHIFQETLVVAAPPAGVGSKISDVYTMTGVVNQIDKHSGAAPRGTDPPERLEVPPANPAGTAGLTENLTRVVAGSPPFIVNSGTYRSNIDVFALGLHVHY